MEIIFDPNIHRDDLICPITLELLRDPVIAKDGHVYEREAITRWIIEHKTSPLTRQSLEIQDLFPATHIRHIIEQRRSSLVSHNTSYMTAIDVPSTEQINTKHAIKSSQRKTNNCSKKVLIWLCILLLIGILLSIVLPVVLRVRSKEENFNTVSSRYASSLTNQHPTLKLDNYYLYYYEAIQVIPSISGTYQFTTYSNYDMMTRFYVSDFNPLYPNDKLMLFSNYGREKNQCKFMVTLSKQSIYYLVVTTESVSITRSFSVVVTGSSDVDFNCMPTPLPRTTRAPVSTTTSSSVLKTIYLTDLDIYNQTFRRLNAQDGNYFYDILQLLISVNGFYNFTSDSLHNICLYIYVNKFNPLKPNKNLVGSSDYHDYLSCSHVVTYLHTNSTFFLVVTTWAPDVIGVYSVTGAGPAYLTFWRTTPSSI